jgi:protein required for attachment to host cells
MNMAAKQLPTWIVVLDGAQARFFQLRQGENGQVFEEIAASLAAKPRPAEKPGRGFATGKARGVVEPRQNVRKLEKHDFIHDVAEVLDNAAGKRAYGQLVLAAPPRSLGELREVLSERVLAALTHEFPKTLTNLPTDALWGKLSAMLLTAAKPLTRRIKGKPIPAVPVTVTFRNTEASQAVQADAIRYAIKLSRKFPRIKSCKVAIVVPRRRTMKGKSFEVAIETVLNRRTIATKSAGEGGHSNENAHLALRGAFEAIERQLADHAGKRDNATRARRGSVKALATADED